MPDATWKPPHKQAPTVLNFALKTGHLAMVLVTKEQAGTTELYDWIANETGKRVSAVGCAAGHGVTRYPKDITLVNCPMYHQGSLRSESFARFYDACCKAAESGTAVVVHCNQSFHRGVLLAAAVMVKTGFGTRYAFNFIAERRIIYKGHLIAPYDWPQSEKDDHHFQDIVGAYKFVADVARANKRPRLESVGKRSPVRKRPWELHSMDEITQKFCNMHLRPKSTRPAPPPFPPPRFIRSAEIPAGAITQAPSVWAWLDEETADDDLQWLLKNYLFDKPASLKLLQSGQAVPLEQEEKLPPHIRLETLIKLTEQKRSKWIQNTNDILPDETLKLLLDEWKDDYESWMNQKTQDEWRRLQRSNRREWTSVRFGNFLFKICGFYHLVIFWLYVHASPTTLSIFRQVFCEETSSVWKETSDDKLKRAVQAVRDAEIRSFTAVRRLH